VAVAANPRLQVKQRPNQLLGISMGGPTKMKIDLSRGVIELECEQEAFQEYLKEVREFVMDISAKRPSAEQTSDTTESGNTDIPVQLQLLPTSATDQQKRVAVELTSQELREFVGALALRESEMEYVLAFTYYLIERRGWIVVSQKDLEECYRLYGRPVPRVDKAVGNAAYRYSWLVRDKNGGVALTREGKNYIEFPDNRTNKSTKSLNGSKRESNGAGTAKARVGSGPKDLKPCGDLNLYGGEGRESFVQFSEQKAPKDNKDRIAIAAYYLLYKLGQESFTDQDIYTCFVTANWKSPEYLRNNIINHKNQYAFYIFTDDKSGFKGTMRLKNYVEFDMARTSL
jgi:hypothetical protein